MVPFRYNARSMLVRKVTTIVTAVGIALTVFVFAGSLMLSEGIKRAVAQTGRADTVIVLRKGSDAELMSALTNEQLQMLAKDGVAAGDSVVPEVVIIVTAEHANDTTISNVLIRGMPAHGMAFRPEAKIISGRAPKPGTNEVVVGKGIAGRFKGMSIGQTFDLRRNRPLQVVGEFEADGSTYEAEVWGDIDVIRNALGRSAGVSSARVRLSSPDRYDAYRNTLENDKQLSVKVLREADYYAKQSEDTSKFLSGMGIAAAILFSIAAMIGSAITMNGAIANRTREIGTLRALGFSRLAILTSFLLEAIFLSLLGGALGLVLVMLLSLVTFPVMNFATFSEIVIGFRATGGVVLTALIFSGIMGLIGGLVPAIRASRVSPVEAMRG